MGEYLHELGHKMALYFVLPVGGTATAVNYFFSHRSKFIAAAGTTGLLLVLMANFGASCGSHHEHHEQHEHHEHHHHHHHEHYTCNTSVLNQHMDAVQNGIDHQHHEHHEHHHDHHDEHFTSVFNQLMHAIQHGIAHHIVNIAGCALLLGSNYFSRQEACGTCNYDHGFVKFCNGNNGDNRWSRYDKFGLGYKGNNRTEYMISSAPMMNQYYFENSNYDPSFFTMCHEIGHGFGSPAKTKTTNAATTTTSTNDHQ